MPIWLDIIDLGLHKEPLTFPRHHLFLVSSQWENQSPLLRYFSLGLQYIGILVLIVLRETICISSAGGLPSYVSCQLLLNEIYLIIEGNLWIRTLFLPLFWNTGLRRACAEVLSTDHHTLGADSSHGEEDVLEPQNFPCFSAPFSQGWTRHFQTSAESSILILLWISLC